MRSTRALTRLGLLAAGVGIGAAFASMPAIASADTSSDWLSAVDSFLSSAAPAADTTPALNLAISIDGMSFQSGDATAFSGPDGDIAIANGAGASAYAFGTNNYASVDGTGSSAVAGGYDAAMASGSHDDTAFAFGSNDLAYAGGDGASNPGAFDYAVIFGNNDTALSGGDAAGSGSYDGAYVEGNDLGTAQAQGSDYLADILKFYGDGSTSTTAAAAESGGHLTDLLSGGSGAAADASNVWTELLSGGSGAAADASNLWTELLSAFDGGSAAADASNLWTELASLF
ncbi:MAG TPA: hypothetical protein VH084_03175 [Mycobacterium sp.]|nr:hypothetical protein [Mycobacterium sp.]